MQVAHAMCRSVLHRTYEDTECIILALDFELVVGPSGGFSH